MQVKMYRSERGAKAFQARVQAIWPGCATQVCCTCGLDFRNQWYVEIEQAGHWYPLGPIKR